METFAGVLLATTNRLDALDPASIRRFDLKVAFELPGATELEALGRALCARVGVRVPLEGCFARLKGLAAGDFAAVARQVAVLESPSLHDILSILSQECQLKRGKGNGNGIV
jgi:SpoVK/Ycf46/Vps4 family AAA+-type ATPase